MNHLYNGPIVGKKFNWAVNNGVDLLHLEEILENDPRGAQKTLVHDELYKIINKLTSLERLEKNDEKKLQFRKLNVAIKDAIAVVDATWNSLNES